MTQMIMDSVTLIPAVWEAPPMSKKALMMFLQEGNEFTIVNITNPHCGAYTTLRELKEAGYTTAEIRYGKNKEKVWYGTLPEPTV